MLLADRTGRTSRDCSTVDHLLLERRVLDLLDELSATVVDPLPEKSVEHAIAAEAPGLGADQAAAVRALCSSRQAVCSLIAPAGFGKTTTVHAAATAASAAGHPVLGLAATNQAAGELRQAGVPAMTIARFALDGAILPAGAVIVLDEVSQVARATPRSSWPPSPPPPAPRSGASAIPTRLSPSGPVASPRNSLTSRPAARSQAQP